jgi:hypothetical protein
VLATILEDRNPTQAMSKELSRLNSKGRIGIKNDVINTLYGKSKMSKPSETSGYMLSGDKMHSFWTENKSTLSKPFNEPEVKRIEQIINTLRLSGSKEGLATNRAQDMLQPKHGVMSYLARVIAARTAATHMGGGTAGGGLQAANMASSRAKQMIGELDIGRAKKVLADSITDEELYRAISADFTAPNFEKTKHWRTLQGWMIANTVEKMEGAMFNEIEDDPSIPIGQTKTNNEPRI